MVLRYKCERFLTAVFFDYMRGDRENQAVYILAVGVKPKNQLFIGGEVIEL